MRGVHRLGGTVSTPADKVFLGFSQLKIDEPGEYRLSITLLHRTHDLEIRISVMYVHSVCVRQHVMAMAWHWQANRMGLPLQVR